MLWDIGRWGLASVLDVQSLVFFIKENWICAMTRHYAELSINLLLTRNLHFDSDVKQWSHPLTIRLHYLWAKSSNRTSGQFECDVLSFVLFTFSSCAKKTRLIAKWALKMWIIINKKDIWWYFWTTAHAQEYKATKRQIVGLSFEIRRGGGERREFVWNWTSKFKETEEFWT